MDIWVINPTITSRWNKATERIYADAARPGTRVTVASLEWGTASIECARDEALAIPNILGRVVEAADAGADAVIIDCMADPGLDAARELVRIPVIGAAQSSMHLASILGHRFSVLAIWEADIPAFEHQAARCGLSSRLASVRAFNIPVLALEDDPEATLRVLVDLGERAVAEDGAHVLIPGCTGLAGLAPTIRAGLAERGCSVPVLDPPSVALKLAESLVDLGLAHSERTYLSPPSKEIRWPTGGLSGLLGGGDRVGDA